MKPKILTRDYAIIMSMAHVRVVILKDRALVFNHQCFWGQQLTELMIRTLKNTTYGMQRQVKFILFL